MTPIGNTSNFAAMDIGSHTIRLLIADCTNKQIRPLCVERAITRLAHGFQTDHNLSATSTQQSIAVLIRYAEMLKHYQVSAAACGATGVIRQAANSGEFLQAIAEATGLQPVILSEGTEAVLSAKGALSALPAPRDLILCFDLGGGSTEFLLLDPKQTRPLWSASAFIGAATITERYLSADPPSEAALVEAHNAIRATIDSTLLNLQPFLRERHIPTGLLQVVGTAGTATTLAAMYLKMTHYQPHRVNGLVLAADWLSNLSDHLAKLPLAARRRLPGLEQGREDIILGGALIVGEILRHLQQPRLTVTDAGLLEGLLIQLIEQQYQLPQTLLTPLTWRWEKS